MFDSDRTMGIVAEVVDIIERKVKANNIIRAKSGNKIVIVSLTELGLERCDGDVATLVNGRQLSNCKVIDSRSDGDAFMFHVKPS